MSTLLRLFLPASWPAQHSDCDWWLFDASGQRLQQGHSEPRHWPLATHCEVVLSADQCLPHVVELPLRARARNLDVIGYALEEQLLGDSDGEHLVLGERLPSVSRDSGNEALQPHAVWVMRRNRLESLLAALRAVDRQPSRLISELQLTPAPQGNAWTLVLHADHGHVRSAYERGYCFDRQHALPATPQVESATPLHSEPIPLELQLALAGARAQGQAPVALILYETRDAALSPASLEAWQATLQLPLRRAEASHDWRAAAAQDARNLLTGAYAPARSRSQGWSVLRPAAWLATTCLLLYSTYSLASWFWLSQQRSELQQQIKVSFQATFPQAQAMVDPPLQMQRLHDQLQHQHGQLGSQDFLPLVGALSQALPQGTLLQSLDYADGRLEAALQLASQQNAVDLPRHLEQRGLTVVVKDTQPHGNGVLITLALRRAL